ncbi:Max-binding protein MNT, partial [Ophiophagus hannah]
MAPVIQKTSGPLLPDIKVPTPPSASPSQLPHYATSVLAISPHHMAQPPIKPQPPAHQPLLPHHVPPPLNVKVNPLEEAKPIEGPVCSSGAHAPWFRGGKQEKNSFLPARILFLPSPSSRSTLQTKNRPVSLYKMPRHFHPLFGRKKDSGQLTHKNRDKGAEEGGTCPTRPYLTIALAILMKQPHSSHSHMHAPFPCMRPSPSMCGRDLKTSWPAGGACACAAELRWGDGLHAHREGSACHLWHACHRFAITVLVQLPAQCKNPPSILNKWLSSL